MEMSLIACRLPLMARYRKLNANRLLLTVLISALTALLLFASTVQAAGVSVVPGEITLRVDTRSERTTRLMVGNPSKDVMLFEVYADEFERAIEATPKSFTLESGREQEVVLAISLPEEGLFKTNISVVGRPLASSAFAATSGVKVPLTITVENQGGLASALNTLRSSGWIGVVALLLAAFIVWRNKKSAPGAEK